MDRVLKRGDVVYETDIIICKTLKTVANFGKISVAKKAYRL